MTMAAFVYEEAQSRHVLRQDHVFQPNRLQLTYELLQCYGAFEDSLLVAPKMAEDTDLLSFHTAEYVEAVKSLSRGEQRGDTNAFNFSATGDNPPYEGMYEVSAMAVGASLLAATLVARGEVNVAFNISGGLHHAAPGYASGFCVFNDAVIAILSLVKQGLRIAYVDIDAHHGDGVQRAFYESDRVLTISLHEWGRYLFPGTGDVGEKGKGAGTGYSVNLPLLPYTDDQTYIWAFKEIVPPLVDRFQPDIILTQLGCDTHYLDPLTHLMLTTAGYTGVVEQLKVLAPTWVALGGGGYEMGVVARAWTLAYGVMAEREWPDEIPAEFQDLYGLKRLRDEGTLTIDSASEEREQAREFAERGVAEIKRTIFPLHRI
jgi:acetoin utilization protein AcuC